MQQYKDRNFHSRMAINAGLMEAIKSGATKITTSYEMTKEGSIEFKQNEFKFIDKNGDSRCGKFKIRFRDTAEITTFLVLFLESTLRERL